MKKSVKYCALLLALVFLSSGLLKAFAGNQFADLLLLYGPSWFSIFSPAIIFVELCLGLFLLLNVNRKATAMVSVCFLICVSAIFAYGVFFLGITKCGCFGLLDFLDDYPLLVFLRNAFLIALGLVVYFYSSSTPISIATIIISFVVSLSMYICGLSMGQSYKLPNWLNKMSSHYGEIDNLARTLKLSPDSSYVVYLFSFSCPHCENSYANVEQYKKLNLVDSVIGVAIEDSLSQIRFERLYSPIIPIETISSEMMSSFTRELPILLYINNNKIINMEVGSVTSPAVFLD